MVVSKRGDLATALRPIPMHSCIVKCLKFKVPKVPKVDAHVKSPFYMDLGIKGFRNCELFNGVMIMSILKSGKITTFYETIKVRGAKMAVFT